MARSRTWWGRTSGGAHSGVQRCSPVWSTVKRQRNRYDSFLVRTSSHANVVVEPCSSCLALTGITAFRATRRLGFGWFTPSQTPHAVAHRISRCIGRDGGFLGVEARSHQFQAELDGVEGNSYPDPVTGLPDVGVIDRNDGHEGISGPISITPPPLLLHLGIRSAVLPELPKFLRENAVRVFKLS